ncbi:unnamed protein product [Knipowitschia caucasica]|uniref:Carbonic anhydrase n=1 Tax=Knipowitschia caucasica TaxID=637954 RepID=A0AAV2KDD6_KNICA
MMNLIGIAIVVLSITPLVHSSNNSFAWCYHDASCNAATWATQVAQHCAGSRQSPIDIMSKKAKYNANLTSFKFTNFDSKTALTTIMNTGRTVKVVIGSGVTVSGGGLSEAYTSHQLNLHWGNGTSVPGSEHTMDGKRYPMELHILSTKSSHKGNMTVSMADSKGFAAFGFLVQVDEKTTGKPMAWKTLTSYLSQISQKDQSVSVSGISLDELLTGVNRKRFYRYMGSLTTPTCDEAVVWTVFKEPVVVSKDLINLFASTVRIGNGTSVYMRNTYRSVQAEQGVTHSSGPMTRPTFGLFLIALALWMS